MLKSRTGIHIAPYPIMKATSLLKEQHRKVEALFAKIEKGNPNVLVELANNLVAHMAIEQEIFYPAVRSLDRDQVAESFEEHSVAELALKRALETDSDDEQFSARVTVLKELISHHVKEEESELFPNVEKKMSEADLDELAAAMQERFPEVLASGYESSLPEGFDETSADQALDEADVEEDPEELRAEDDDSSDADTERKPPIGRKKVAKRGPATQTH